jgi:hypothetical protein
MYVYIDSQIPPPPPPEITFYFLGRPVPNGTLPRAFSNTVLTTAKQNFNNVIPTTYEASKEYLDEEILKPKGQRDLRREMCMIVVTDIPGDSEIILKLDTAKILFPLYRGQFSRSGFGRKSVLIQSCPTGSMFLYPTIDVPPTSFGTPQNGQSDMLIDRQTGKPGQASVMLTYFSRSGDTHDYIGDSSHKIQTESLPFE